jgi:hypothetical protein
MNPLIGFALDHAEEASMDHLERIRFEIDKNKEQPTSGVGSGQVV